MIAPAAISVVIDDILTDLQEAIEAMTEAEAPPEDELKIYGPQDNAANNPAPPCIAWTPGKESWSPGQHQGKPGSPAALWTREIPVTFEIFGGLNAAVEGEESSTYLHETDVSEALMAKLVNAIHRRLSQHGYRVLDGGWGPSIRMGLGMVYVLVISFRLPLVKEDNPTVTITAVDTEVEFASEA
jgi:hypothetical protein